MDVKRLTSDMVIDFDPDNVVELSSEQLENVAGGTFIPREMKYICDDCGVEATFLDINHNYMLVFECPSCKKCYSAY